MAERQAHGFRFEDSVKRILGVEENKSYTDKWDIGSNISVKFISSKGTVDMGSVVRIFEALNNPGWTMILGTHTNKVCERVVEIEFTEEVCEALKGDLTLEDVTEFDRQVKSYGLGKHQEARDFAKQWKKEHKQGMLTIQPKIDSKTQRRVQCGINKTNLKKLFDLQQSERFAELVGEDFGS
jgi:hypothetical protein